MIKNFEVFQGILSEKKITELVNEFKTVDCYRMKYWERGVLEENAGTKYEQDVIYSVFDNFTKVTSIGKKDKYYKNDIKQLIDLAEKSKVIILSIREYENAYTVSADFDYKELFKLAIDFGTDFFAEHIHSFFDLSFDKKGNFFENNFASSKERLEELIQVCEIINNLMSKKRKKELDNCGFVPDCGNVDIEAADKALGSYIDKEFEKDFEM